MYQNLIILFVLFSFVSHAQQTIRGTVIDQESRQPIPFATIVLQNTDPIIGTTSDMDGNFRLDDVPLGRHALTITYLGYEPSVLPNLEVTAGKEVVLEITLQESFETLDEVVVTADADRTQSVNELASVSSRSLSVEEASRYAAALADPARQALNFAGVGGGGDDLNNTIVIRGNSPSGLLWRLEGVEIPNPNHFASLGSTGGAISMLSGNVLSTSDFFTAAFPAEYGNATAGVFDLRFRKGNNEKRETTLGLGFLGAEVAAEGPFKKGSRASYLVNYRYSTLSILSNLGIDVAGDFLPAYQDLSFNLNFPTEKLGIFNVFGLGGNSWANTRLEDEELPNSSRFEISWERALTAIGGIKHVLFAGKKGYFRSVLVGSRQSTDYRFDTEESKVVNSEYEESFGNTTFRLSSFYNHKFDARKTWRTGFVLSTIDQNLNTVEVLRNSPNIRFDLDGNTTQYQAFTHFKWRLTEQLTLNSGLHFLHYGLTQKSALEPRLALDYQATPRSIFSLGAGLHSRTENLGVYLIDDAGPNNTRVLRNQNLGLARAAHIVGGWDFNVNQHTRLKVEGYYQYLYDLPISVDTSRSFISINAADIFGYLAQRDTALVNGGTGRNYGLEFTLERFLHNDFYYLATLSLYQSEFSLDQKRFFNTQFNGNYILNVLGGKEFRLGKENNNVFGVNGKVSVLGGQRYTPADLNKSRLVEETVFSEQLFSEQLDLYYRFDVGLSYRWNRNRSSHILSLNVQNVTNRLNAFRPDVSFNPQTNQVNIETRQQTGTIPILKYQFQF